MKKSRFQLLLTMLCLWVGVSFTSCSSDDDDYDGSLIDISKIYGYWKDQDNTDNWLFKTDYTGLYWDSSESTEEEAATGSGLFKWEFDQTTGLMRTYWQEMSNAYGDPDPDDPSQIMTLTDKVMEYKTTTGEYHTFEKYTK
jgi:hypothetical protein